MAKKNYLDKATSEDVAYIIHALADTDDQEERQRLAERLFRDLPISDTERDLGKEIHTHIAKKRAAKIETTVSNQIQAFATLLGVHDAINDGDMEAARKFLLELKNMFHLTEEARKEATRLHSERWKKEHGDRRHHSEGKLAALAGADVPAQTSQTEQAAPEAPEAAIIFKLPTAKMRQALALFDDLSDDNQVDYLTTLWGQS